MNKRNFPFGYPEVAKADLAIINIIHERQGSSILIESIAIGAREANKRFKLSESDVSNLIDNLTNELRARLIKELDRE